ncbi:MAG: CPBP family intramembrane metalloprotease [Rhodobacteraceae bacterium]|nr:CPBP family intramembrane metalloprotease [Paracoccaceae bacterium]
MAKRYPAHDALVAPARARREIWRIIASFGLIAVVIFGLNSVLQAGLLIFAPDFWIDEIASAEAQVTTPGAMLILLGTFAFLIIGVFAATRLIHQRDPWEMFGPWSLLKRQFIQVLGALVALGAVILILPPYGSADAPLTLNLAPKTWALLLPFSLTAVLVQVSAEEVLFRGYLQQQLAARFHKPVVWLAVPSLLFAVGHYLPSEAGPNAMAIMVWSGVFGILLADMTARAGTLGPAIALHLANNASAFLFVSFPDTLNGLSLYTIPQSMVDPDAATDWLPVEFAVMFVSWLAARLAIRR